MGLGIITIATLVGAVAALFVAGAGGGLVTALIALSSVSTIAGLATIAAHAHCPANPSRLRLD